MILPVEMRKNYLERRFNELKKLQENKKNPDFLFIKNLGHQIKGNAKSFDFNDLTEIGITFEKVAKSKDLSSFLLAIDDFEKHLKLCFQRLSLEESVNDK